MVSSGARRQHGFAYVWALLLMSLFAAMVALAQRVESSLLTREKELDLLHVGGEFRRAIREYHDNHPQLPERYPRTLEELTDPKGELVPRRYLRRVYRDPITGSAEWGLVKSPTGGIVGVYSLSESAPRKTHGFDKDLEHFSRARTYRDWVFSYDPAGLAGPARQ